MVTARGIRVAFGIPSACMVAVGCETGSGTSDLVTRLHARTESLLAAAWVGDGVATADHYTEDAVLLPPDGTSIRGREAIREFWSGGGFDSAAVETMEVEAGGPVAFHVARYALWTRGEGGASAETRGLFLIVWERGADGVWRVRADMWN